MLYRFKCVELVMLTLPVIPSIYEMEGGRSEKFRVNLGYIVKFENSLGYMRPCFKKQTKNKNKTLTNQTKHIKFLGICLTRN